jgi:lipoate-protein ligase A
MNPMIQREKIPGGKMVCLELRVIEGAIADITISGDFFLHPEEAIASLERRLNGLDSSTPETKLKDEIDVCLLSEDARLIGASSSDIARLIRRAVDSCSGE